MHKDNHNFKKHFGQNFIKSVDTALNVITNLDLKASDEVIEIGPGDGRFTDIILQHDIKSLTLIDIDPELTNFLKEKYAEILSQPKTHLKVINQSILDFAPDLTTNNKQRTTKIFGALPYNISKKIIAKFIEGENKPERMVFILQKEVAVDYIEPAPKSSFLSNYIKVFAEVEYIMTIDKAQFEPMPKVDGGVLIIKPFDKPVINNPEDFIKFLKNGYRNQRKKLIKGLKSIYRETDWNKIYTELELDENTRAQQLEFETWLKLYEEYGK